MKKIIAIVLAVMMFASMATVALAAESTTTLTTEVPAATYTLNIPADQKIEFGELQTDIGTLTISKANGFAEGKNVAVTVSYNGNFVCDAVSTKIPYTLSITGESDAEEKDLSSGSILTFYGKEDGSTGTHARENFWYSTGMGRYEREMNVTAIFVNIDSTSWGKALGGAYTTTITFTAEVVAG